LGRDDVGEVCENLLGATVLASTVQLLWAASEGNPLLLTCLVEDGRDYVELRGVSISGRARLVEDYDDVVHIGSRIATRMADGADLGAYGDDLVRQQARKRVGVVVEPEKVASWDHRKMTGSG